MRELSELLEEIKGRIPQSTMETQTDPPVLAIPCGVTLPSGKRCAGQITIYEKTVGGNRYEAATNCMECDVQWIQQRTFGSLDPDASIAGGLRDAIVETLKIAPQKTEQNKAARDQLRALVKNPSHGASVLLCGPPGTGKTFLGLHAMSLLIRQRIGCLYLPEHVFLRAWRISHADEDALAGWGRGVISAARSREMLMLDDFGQERSTSDGALDALESLIMARYDAKLPMIITSNRTVESLSESRGSRVMSRIAEMTSSSVVEMLGEDWRSKNG